MPIEIIEPDDPRYLDEFYRGWGVGQSITRQQEQLPADQAKQEHPEPQQEKKSAPKEG